MYVCMYACTYVCMYVCMYVCRYVTSLYVCVYIRQKPADPRCRAEAHELGANYGSFHDGLLRPVFL